MGQIAAIAVAFVVVAGIGTAVLRDRLDRMRRFRAAVDVPGLLRERLDRPSPAASGVIAAARLPEVLSHDGGDLDLWDELEERVDLASLRPKLAEDIEIRVFRLRWGNDYAMVANPRILLHLTLEPWEAELAQRMDGTRTVGDLIVERLENDGDLDPEAVTDLVQVLALSGFLDPPPLDVAALITEAIEVERGGLRRLRKFASSFSLEWNGVERTVDAIYRRWLKVFFAPPVVVATAIMAVAGLVTFVMVQRSGNYSLGGRAAPLDSLLLIIFGWVLTFSHELGHAAVLVHHKRRIKNAGFMLYFGSPAFFVDASDGLMLDPRARIMQSFAGPFAELVLAGVSSIVLFFLPKGPAAELLYRFALLNYFVIFLNLVPLLELDGYWILADVIQVPDLRPRSIQFIQHDLWHKIRTRERLSPQEFGLAIYGIAGVAFTVFAIWTALFFWRQTFGNLFLSLWRGGPGPRILLVLLILFLGGPAVRGLLNLGRATYRLILAIARKIRFKLETGWRVEAAELIDALPAFEDLPADVLGDLAGRVTLRAIRPGQAVTRQGDRSTAFWVVRRGTFNVETEHPDTGDVELLRTIGRGESFGELGLLQNAKRQATVRAATDGEVFEVDKGTFDHLLADSIHAPEFGPTLQALAELRELPAFAHLGIDRLAELLEHGGWVSAAPGTELMRQGETGDAFYAIAGGQADVVRDGERIATIGPGGYAGEVALLRDAPRNATVVARTPLRAYRLDREGFDALVADAFTKGVLRPTTHRTWEH